MMRKYFAELLGTFGLTLAILFSLKGLFPLPTPMIAALTLGLFVYTLGHISGTHLNPAVTLGLLTLRKIGLKDAAGYAVAQFLGAWIASLIFHELVAAPTILPVVDTASVGIVEFIGTSFFAFGIAAVVYGKVSKELSGIVIGGSLLLGISFASLFSNGILNPAVALGIRSFSLMYVLGPVVGAFLGMWTFRLISRE